MTQHLSFICLHTCQRTHTQLCTYSSTHIFSLPFFSFVPFYCIRYTDYPGPPRPGAMQTVQYYSVLYIFVRFYSETPSKWHLLDLCYCGFRERLSVSVFENVCVGARASAKAVSVWAGVKQEPGALIVALPHAAHFLGQAGPLYFGRPWGVRER